MSDQHRAGGGQAPSGPSAEGFASGEPELTVVRGTPLAASEAAAFRPSTGGGGESLTEATMSLAHPAVSRPIGVSMDERGEGESGGGATPATGRRTATSGGPVTSAAAEPDGAQAEERTGEQSGETRGEREEKATSREEPAAGQRSNGGGLRARASRIGLRAAALAPVAGRAGEGARAVATAAAPGGGPSDWGAGSPGRPRKPMLAGAAMAGVILIAVPLLVMATNKDEDDPKKVASSADTVLGENGEEEGEFVAESPSPRASKAPGGEERKSSPSSEGTDGSVPEGAGPDAGESQEAGKADGEEDGGKGQKEEAPGQKKGEAEAGRRRTPANPLPAVLTRTLIKNSANGTCADIPGTGKGSAGGRIVQAKCDNHTSDNQLWSALKKSRSGGPGGAPLFVLRNVKAKRCLDLPGSGAANKGEKVKESACQGTNGDNQLWWLDKRQDGHFWIRNAASHNMCLNSYGPKSDTRDLIVSPCAAEKRDNHEWVFTRG